MRAALLLLAMCGTAIAKPKPCPNDLRKALVPLYGDRKPAAEDIVVAACVWGKFAAKPGWFVEHVLPWGSGMKATMAAAGGEAFIAESGRVLASRQTGGIANATVYRMDLDGDGILEAALQYRWSDAVSPDDGDIIEVLRVNDGEIVLLGQIVVSTGGLAGSCIGLVSFNEQHRIEVSRAGTLESSGSGQATCPPKSTYVLRDGELVEQ